MALAPGGRLAPRLLARLHGEGDPHIDCSSPPRLLTCCPAVPNDTDRLELAAVAARLIAEDGCDYATAKRRAVEETHGAGARVTLPDNALVEAELRRYLDTFGGERHRQQLLALRQVASQLMQRLEPFRPHLVGAVLNGTATEHSGIRLQLFADSAKDVELFLLDQGTDFDVEPGDTAPGGAEEILHLDIRPARTRGMPPQVGVELAVHPVDAIRVAARARAPLPGAHPVENLPRANLAQLRELLAATEVQP